MTIQANPETTFNSLWQQFGDLGRGSLSEMALKRLERDIDILLRVDRAGALELRSYVAAYRGQVDEALKIHEQALFGGDSVLRSSVRCLLMLHQWDYHEQFLRVLEKRRELIRNDLPAIRTVAKLLALSGETAMAESLLVEAVRLGKVIELKDVIGEDVPEDTFDQVDSIEESTSAELDGAIQFVRQFAAAKGVVIVNVDATQVASDRGDELLLCTFSIDQPVEQVAELEWEMFAGIDEIALPAVRNGELILALASSR